MDVDFDLVLAASDKAELLSFATSEVIFSINQDAHRLYFVTQGEVALYDEKDLRTLVKKNDYFGEEALFLQKPRAYKAEALSKTDLLAISRIHLVELMLESPQIALSMLRDYTNTTPLRERTQSED